VPDPRPRAVARVIGLAFICLVALVAVVVLATGTVLPRCALCHGGGALGRATQASIHKGVDCASCHVGSGAAARVSFAFQQAGHLAAGIAPAAAAGAAAVGDDRCLSCHAAIQTRVSTFNGLRIKHSSCARGSKCTDCHSNTAHGVATIWPKTYNMDLCLHCHGTDPKLAACDLCHQSRKTQDRLTTGPWAVTHGPNWRQTHGAGDEFTCATCHPKGYCDQCHGPGLPHTPQFRADHPAVAALPGARCSSCHKPSFCDDCHGLPMPHPLKFIETHSTTVKTGGKAVCERCHSATDCTKCHEMHVHPGGAIKLTPPKPGT
jgi:hypothetical protein